MQNETFNKYLEFDLPILRYIFIVFRFTIEKKRT